MAKEKSPGSKTRRDLNRYFPDQFAVQTNQDIKGQFQVALAILKAKSKLSMLDQDKMASQTCINMLMLWMSRTIESKGISWLEEEMAPVMNELSRIVAEEMMTRGRLVPPQFLPEGFSYMVGRPGEEAE
ncbi:hypothetical protein V5E97_09895 [Singulisphaera sp. Ch08]|uniref:Uncharacterized protein n=1 Tax=Singulisphaera sp. Ch08 TaxID=3120278 RepID=A0AAU7CMJ7_9BACT